MDTLASPRSRSFHRTSTGFTTWPAMSGNGSATGIAPITTRNSLRPETLHGTRRDRIRPMTPPSQRRKSASIEADHFSARTSIARATWSARAVKARSAPAATILGSDVSRMRLKFGLGQTLNAVVRGRSKGDKNETLEKRGAYAGGRWSCDSSLGPDQTQHRNYLGR